MMFSFVFIFCLALCASFNFTRDDMTHEKSIDEHGRHGSPRFLGRFILAVLFIGYLAAEFLKTFFDVIEIYGDDLYVYPTPRRAVHLRDEYETSDDSDGEHQHSFVEFRSIEKIMKPAVAFVICLELCLACSNSPEQNELITDLEKKCHFGYVINRYMNLSICYLTIVAILFFIVLLKCLMDVVISYTSNDNADVEGRSSVAEKSAGIANTEKRMRF
ncbi:hypothetical protein T11_6583 [Trichinella zimbabwensis]|uniref:Uncharacterized protein n=1 Tax=Trichinella zimbabwensis TaxID=268475 RepID=A0A0V1HTH2_9BILA|nr:hypothetical protein T11_16182 [Trichinella zimbabwensis]KRZ13492.1 hypothetical protein T11_6583 [Trichinella zimbabwensis]